MNLSQSAYCVQSHSQFSQTLMFSYSLFFEFHVSSFPFFFYFLSDFQRTIEKYHDIQNTYRYFNMPMHIDMISIYQHQYIWEFISERRSDTSIRLRFGCKIKIRCSCNIVVSKISIRIDMYRYFQNIGPFFNIFKISILIEKF